MSSYCTTSDVYNAGIPRGTLPNPARLIASVSTATNLLTLDGHGLSLGQAIQFRTETGALPTPIVEGSTYYALPSSDSAFAISATQSGQAIDLTSAGSDVWLIVPLPFDEWISWASAIVESFLPAHLVPLSAPYPPIVVSVTADLAASRGLTYVGGTQVDIQARLTNAQKLLDKWANGQPIRGAIVPPSANLAYSRSGHRADPRGWDRGTGRIP